MNKKHYNLTLKFLYRHQWIETFTYAVPQWFDLIITNLRV